MGRSPRSSPRKKDKKHKHAKNNPDRREIHKRTEHKEKEKEIKLLQRLAAERERAKEKKRLEKELMKAKETPGQKRLRRIMKKEMKERKKKEEMGWDSEYLQYTNSDNPFGDSKLLEKFVWEKKQRKEGRYGEDDTRKSREENRRELEKVKKRRIERDLEIQKRNDENSRLQNIKEEEKFKEWGKNEDQFHLEQARYRSKIRIQDGRPKPIDLLARYISAEEEEDAIEMHEPYTCLKTLEIKDLLDLIEDIKVYMELEKGKNLDYWNDITILVEDELNNLKKDKGLEVGHREGIHESVTKEVVSVFKDKNLPELEKLKKDIERKLNSGESGLDITYWETLLTQLKAHMAKARLRERHKENLKKKLEQLKAEQGVEVKSEPMDDDVQRRDNSIPDDIKPGPSCSANSIDEDDLDEEEPAILSEEYNSALYSPLYIPLDDIEPGTIVVTEEDDVNRLEFSRSLVLKSGSRVEDALSNEERAMLQEARKDMKDDEFKFTAETSLENQTYLWSDKYRPRKPRYFNRVHTGFEWNKYNQTHYDMDNPPPKIVQGYKFNIFYPDLIDKNSTPQYFVKPCPDNEDFAILRFHAGPPYEDIAFKIVHREWECSYKRGFRCQFQNSCLQLWFHFKRYRYRR